MTNSGRNSYLENLIIIITLKRTYRADTVDDVRVRLWAIFVCIQFYFFIDTLKEENKCHEVIT